MELYLKKLKRDKFEIPARNSQNVRCLDNRTDDWPPKMVCCEQPCADLCPMKS